MFPQEGRGDYAIYATPLCHVGDPGKLVGGMATC